MKKFIIALIAMFAIASAANAANAYKIDDAAIDAVVENAVAISPMSLMAELPASVPASASISSSKSPVAAILLTFFLGEFGVHRHYMGTRPWMWAIYTVTVFGIFGVVPFVDFIVMIVALVEDGSVGRYCGDTRFIMWG